ncbi:MAG: diguanylate cyclase [Halochromatium sp.]
MSQQNLFVIGLDDVGLRQLQQLPQAEHCAFHPLLEVDAIREVAHCDLRELIHQAVDTLAGFKGTVDGIASACGFPATVLVPILANRFDLPSPSLEAVLKCEHSYWNRCEQAEAIPEHVPRFQAFDPFEDASVERLEMKPPYWIHSVESFRSDRVFAVHRPQELSSALAAIRREDALLSKPFRWLLEHFTVPATIRRMQETFVAESMVAGERCTLAGYIHEGHVQGHMLSPGLREPDPFSLCREDDASPLRREVESRVLAIAGAVLARIGLDNAPFSLEVFYDQRSDHIWLLDIHPVISPAGCERPERFQGISPLGVMVNLALGRKPATIKRHTKPNIVAPAPRAKDSADRAHEPAKRVETDAPTCPVLASVEVTDSRILVVDDQEHNLTTLKTMLHDAGFVHIDLAHNSDELFAQLGQRKPDLILLDVRLPGRDGFQICEQLQANPEYAEIPVVFITAMHKDAATIRRAFATGGIDFLTRPFLPEELIARVQIHLRVERYWKQLKEQAHIDPLTGLLNRRAMTEQLEVERERAQRTDLIYALVLADIDHFKPVNDTYGHRCGDLVLKAVASIFKDRIRRSEHLCRWGGEEFLLLLPDTDAAGAAVLAEDLRAAVAATTFACDEGAVTISLSFGIMADSGERPLDVCISLADAALYAAKDAGRNRCVTHAEAARY